MLSQGASVYASEITPSQPVLSERPIRVMVVDDSAVVRGLVSRWVNEEPGLKVVARHANGKLAVEDVVRSAPDIVLLDIEMPVMDGLTALPLLLAARPQLKILIVSTLTFGGDRTNMLQGAVHLVMFLVFGLLLFHP